jgi:2-oxoglutarate ferredoxin oxidoreductase subunit delta
MAQARGSVMVDVEECKGCGLCIDACPPKCLELEAGLSAYGVHPAHYAGDGCTGCGICFYVCPEPGAITVYRLQQEQKLDAEHAPLAEKEPAYAATV